VKRIWIIFIVTFVLSVVVDLVFQGGDDHGAFSWSHILGFFALFGFIACVAIVIISKLIGHNWLQKREDYYDRKDSDD
jgi:hypothetical protein